MSDTVKVTAPVEYKCWSVPGYAVMVVPSRPKQEGMQVLPSTPIADLPLDVLNALAGAWLGQLYASVGRDSPFKLAAQEPSS